MKTFDIYPPCKKKAWMKKGARCFCVGESDEIFKIAEMAERMAFLVDLEGYGHGWESLKNLSQSFRPYSVPPIHLGKE